MSYEYRGHTSEGGGGVTGGQLIKDYLTDYVSACTEVLLRRRLNDSHQGKLKEVEVG